MTQNDISQMLFNMYDIRNRLEGMVTPSDEDYVTEIKVLDVPKDTDGSIFTIGECIDQIIFTLEENDSALQHTKKYLAKQRKGDET